MGDSDATCIDRVLKIEEAISLRKSIRGLKHQQPRSAQCSKDLDTATKQVELTSEEQSINLYTWEYTYRRWFFVKKVHAIAGPKKTDCGGSCQQLADAYLPMFIIKLHSPPAQQAAASKSLVTSNGQADERSALKSRV